MKYGKFLKDSGTIGFVAPSFGASIEPYKSRFENALKVFSDMGYKVKTGPNCYAGEGIGISNTPQNCAKELNEYYLAKDNDVLMAVGGGELMCEILEYVDFEAFAKAEPKWYMGYSDNTNMTYLLATLADTASIYGPCAATFGMRKWHKAIQDSFDVLSGKMTAVSGYDMWELEGFDSELDPIAEYNLTEKKILRRFPDRDTAFSGRLLGGCIDCLVTLLGTKFDKTKEFCEKYKNDGIIWFIEACDLNVFSIRRAIWQMKMAGWFSYVKGFIVGRPGIFGEDMMGLDQYKAITDLLSEYDVPIIMDVDLGHLPPAMPLICGSMADVTVKGNDVTVDMKLI